MTLSSILVGIALCFASTFNVCTAVNLCGQTYSDASSKCDKCPGGIDGECAAGETCFGQMPDCASTNVENRCGSSYNDAAGKCSKCPGGVDGECAAGETCFAEVPACSGTAPPPPTGGCGNLANPEGPQGKFACTNYDNGDPAAPFCWTNRAWWLHNKIRECYSNIECTTYPGGGTSDHEGNALDCWSTSGRPCPAGGAVEADLNDFAAWLLENAGPLEVAFVNWRQRMWSQGRSGEGWRPYSTRGGCTADHLDHVHISLCAGGPPNNPYDYGC